MYTTTSSRVQIQEYKHYTKLSSLRKLYRLGYYDGAISGFCLVNDQKYYFDTVEEFSGNGILTEEEIDDPFFKPPFFRRYLIWKISEGAMAVMDARHKRFQELVGYSSDYDDNGKPYKFDELKNLNSHITKESTARFWKEQSLHPLHKIKLDLTPKEEDIIGWYEIK